MTASILREIVGGDFGVKVGFCGFREFGAHTKFTDFDDLAGVFDAIEKASQSAEIGSGDADTDGAFA